MSSNITKKDDMGGMYLRFSNSDDKVWIVPIKNMRMALNLYQPSRIKGKLVKQFLPYIYFLPFVTNKIGAKKMSVSLNSKIEKLLRDILNIEDFQFSIFEGTPSVHKKTTIQISQGSRIVAYCKISNNEDVINLFKGEQKILDYLHSVGVVNIPVCNYCGEIKNCDGEVLFVQSTVKTNKSKIVHDWGEKHWRFITELHLKTKKKQIFESTHFAKSLIILESYLHCLTSNEAELIQQNINKVRTFYRGIEVEFSAYHADFTPWNMFIEKEDLFVFDFEYAELSYPPYLDWFHFFTQTALFEKHLNEEEIFIAFSNKDIEIGKYFSNKEIGYCSYLLDIISRYIHREKGELSQNTQNMIAVWLKILEKL